MNTAINTILANIGDNPEAMKALLAALAETDKIAKDKKTESDKKKCRCVICLERTAEDGTKVYHPYVMTAPTAKTQKILIADNIIEGQNLAKRYSTCCIKAYALPATEAQIKKLYDLLKQCNKRIVEAVDKAVEAVSAVSVNIDKTALCQQYMATLMIQCGRVIGPHMTKDSKIIEKDVKIIS
jgi:hypothetical protein